MKDMTFAVGEFNVGGGSDVAFKLLDAGCAGDRCGGRVPDDPGERDLRRGAESASATSRNAPTRPLATSSQPPLPALKMGSHRRRRGTPRSAERHA